MPPLPSPIHLRFRGKNLFSATSYFIRKRQFARAHASGCYPHRQIKKRRLKNRSGGDEEKRTPNKAFGMFLIL